MADLSTSFDPAAIAVASDAASSALAAASDAGSKATGVSDAASSALAAASDAASKATAALSKASDASSAAIVAYSKASDASSAAADKAPKDAEYIVGTANATLTAEVVKQYLADNYDPDVYPGSPNALDDEFEDGSINVKWTIVNDPGIAENTYAGFIYTTLTELGTDNFDNLIRMYQTPPTGTATMDFVAKVALSHTGEGANYAEWASVGVYLGDSANDDLIGAVIQLEDAVTSAPGRALGIKSEAGTLGALTTNQPKCFAPSLFVYIKLSKTTANAYTSANTYIVYYSLNGMIWEEVGTDSFTFSGLCDEVGIVFRKPKSQTGTAVGYALVDFFRQTA